MNVLGGLGLLIFGGGTVLLAKWKLRTNRKETWGRSCKLSPLQVSSIDGWFWIVGIRSPFSTAEGRNSSCFETMSSCNR